MASKMNWKSQILNDLFDLKEIRNFESNTDNKGENNKKDVLTTAKPKETVSISKNTVPRNQRWKTSLINKIKEDILNNDSGKFENILKKVNNDKKLQEEKTKISKKEVIQINDSTKEKAKKSVNIGDTIQTKPKSVVIEIDDNQTKKLKDTKINDDSIIIVDNPTKKRKRQSKTKKKGENIDKEKEKDNKNTSKKQKKLKNIDIKEKEKSKPKPIVPKKKYPVLSKMDHLDEKFELTYLIRPNSKREHAENDNSVCIWDCAFEPTIEGQDVSHIVATCGANTVSMIECHTGKVIAKYTNLIEVENYYSLDWTVIKVTGEGDGDKEATTGNRNQYCPILAAGGQLGEVIFLNRMQGECFRYAEPKVSKLQPITQIRFSRENPKWLFVGSEDKYVYMYDIGELNDTEQDEATCLVKFIGLKKDPTSINVVKNNLIVGCSNGLIVVYNLTNIPTVEEVQKSGHPINISINHQFSSLHNTYIDDIIPYYPQYHQTNENSLTNLFFTRGAKDHIALWSVDNLDVLPVSKKKSRKNQEKSLEAHPTIISKLKWDHYVECVRFSLVNDEDETLLLTGSGAGFINIYKLQKDKTLELISTLRHEQSIEAIHKVVLSDDKKYLVGVNEINLAYIWKLN